jgi:hypothetical protein
MSDLRHVEASIFFARGFRCAGVNDDDDDDEEEEEEEEENWGVDAGNGSSKWERDKLMGTSWVV